MPRNATPQSEEEKLWYQGLVNQTIGSSLMLRYGTIDERVNAILFLASDEALYITGSVLPVGCGDQGKRKTTTRNDESDRHMATALDCQTWRLLLCPPENSIPLMAMTLYRNARD